MGTTKRNRATISIRWQTKDSLDSIKHSGQSYDGLIQELTKLWRKEHRVEETQHKEGGGAN